MGLWGQPGATVCPRQEDVTASGCGDMPGLSSCQGKPPTHPSALYWLVPGMPAPCCTMAGLNVVATFRAFIALSFLL